MQNCITMSIRTTVFKLFFQHIIQFLIFKWLLYLMLLFCFFYFLNNRYLLRLTLAQETTRLKLGKLYQIIFFRFPFWLQQFSSDFLDSFLVFGFIYRIFRTKNTIVRLTNHFKRRFWHPSHQRVTDWTITKSLFTIINPHLNSLYSR